MSAAKAKVKRRRKYCPVCAEEVSMSVIRQAEGENDLWWLLCASCNSRYALTGREYQKEKRPDVSAIEKENARIYLTDQTYSVGELLYHPKLDDMGMVVNKSTSPMASCSGAIVVSFMEVGQKTLIEGYAAV
jgi:ribosomal protein L44E